MALAALLVLVGGWQLARVRPAPDETASPTTPSATAATQPASASDGIVTDAAPSPPDGLPSRGAVRPVPRRASDAELAAQLPPDAILAE